MNNTSGGRSKYSKSSLTCSQAHTTPKERTRIILIQTTVSIYTELMTRFLHSWIICTLQVRQSRFVCMAHVTDLQGAYNLVTGFLHSYIIL